MAQKQTLRQFIEVYGIDMNELVSVLLGRRDYLSQEQKTQLAALAPPEAFILPANARRNRDDAPSFGEKFDMLEEVEAQIRLIREMRENVYDDDGNLDVKLAKDTASSATSLLSLLNKLHEEIVNRRRLQEIEDALVESLRDAPEEVRARFFENLESRKKV